MSTPTPNAVDLAAVSIALRNPDIPFVIANAGQFSRLALVIDKAAARIAELEAAIDRELAGMEMTLANFQTPTVALRTAINWHVAVALDPAVSSDAQALIDRGAALAQQVPEPQGDPHDREPIDQSTIDCWRINYGLDKRTPAEAAKWWQDSFHGHAPSGCVAALGVALDELEAERKARSAQQVPAVPGWRWMPEEATEAMCRAAVVYANGNAVYKNVAAEALKIEEAIYGEAYAAMLAAAPLPTPKEAKLCP